MILWILHDEYDYTSECFQLSQSLQVLLLSCADWTLHADTADTADTGYL